MRRKLFERNSRSRSGYKIRNELSAAGIDCWLAMQQRCNEQLTEHPDYRSTKRRYLDSVTVPSPKFPNYRLTRLAL